MSLRKVCDSSFSLWFGTSERFPREAAPERTGAPGCARGPFVTRLPVPSHREGQPRSQRVQGGLGRLVQILLTRLFFEGDKTR